MSIISVMILIIVTLSVLQVLICVRNMKKQLSEEYEDNFAMLTKSNAQLISGKIAEYTKQLQVYTTQDILQTGTDEGIVAWLQSHAEIRSSDFDYVAYVDAAGNFDADNMSHTTVSDRSYFKDIFQKGMDATIDDPVSSKTTGKTVIHVCKAAKSGGRTIGFFNGIVNINTISGLVSNIRIGDTGVAALLSSTMDVVASSGDLEKMTADVQAIKTELAKLSGNSKQVGMMWAKDSKGESVFYTISAIENTPWLILMQVSRDQVYETAMSIRLIMIAGAVLQALVLILIIGIVSSRALKPLQTVKETIQGIASGNADLTKRVVLDHEHKNEIGDVVKGFNMFSEKLQNIISSLKHSKEKLVQTGNSLHESAGETVDAITNIMASIHNMGEHMENQTESVTQTAGSVNQIASNIEELNRMIESQSGQVTQASAAIEEMIGNIRSVDSSITKMAGAFEELAGKAISGVQKQSDVNKRIASIEEESKSLREANSVISSIAGQTNLLAMNAAIEAAHAGEAGKGFSVVADEIRKLSETSSAQSKSIGDQLKRITATISGIVAASNEAGTAFSAVTEGINGTNNLVQEIKMAMSEQEEGSKQITQVLSGMNDITGQVRSASAEMSQGNKAILEEVSKLQRHMDTMRQDMGKMTEEAQSIQQTGNSLANLSGEMDASIKKIGDEVDLFKV